MAVFVGRSGVSVMARHSLFVVVMIVCLTSVALAGTAPQDDDGPLRLSLPTESDRQAWLQSGFRLQLGISGGHLAGLDGSPSGSLVGVVLRAGTRLDADWSLLAGFQYALAVGVLSGLSFSGTLEPTWHISPKLSLAVGFGLAGIVEGRTGRSDADPLPGTLETSYTFPDASTPVASCKGSGALGLVRIDWMTVLGPRSSSGFGLEVVGRWIGCTDDTKRVEPDTARPIVRRQFWPQLGVSASWVVTWR